MRSPTWSSPVSTCHETRVPSETIGRLIGEAGTRQSVDILFAALSSFVPFEMVSVLVYQEQGRPVALYDDFNEPAYRQGLDNYLRHSYVLNPCYQAYLGGLRSGVMRIRDLVSARGGFAAGTGAAGSANGSMAVRPAGGLLRGADPNVPVAVSEQGRNRLRHPGLAAQP